MRSLMAPFALSRQDVAELKARRLAFSYLVKGCQDAVINVRKRMAAAPDSPETLVAQRTVEILEDAVGSWCETLSILRSALNRTSSQTPHGTQRPEAFPGVFMSEPSRKTESLTNPDQTR